MIRLMKGCMYAVTVCLLLVAGIANSEASVKDSVGVKVKGGKIFIMHEVEAGQGLYSVSRRYNVPINDILAANPEVETVLQKGQILLIPTGKDAPFEEQIVKEYFDEKKDGNRTGDSTTVVVSSTFARFHKVKSGETLFSIARQYRTSVDVIKDLNSLNSDVISEGQKLLVPVKEDEFPLPADETVERKDSSERITELEEELVRLRKRIHGENEQVTGDSAAAPGEEKEEETPYEITVDRVEKYGVEKITEKGTIAILRGSTVDSEQRYASHHEAAIGTIIMVTNPATGQAVFVKVIKNHPLNSSRSNMILITESAASRLNITPGAPVEISYAR